MTPLPRSLVGQGVVIRTALRAGRGVPGSIATTVTREQWVQAHIGAT
jgi:hypothetical protein